MSDRSESPSDAPATPADDMEALSASDAAKVMDSLERNRNKILAGVALVAIAAGGYLVATQLKKQAHLDAARAYSAALGKSEIAAFDAVIVEHGGSIAAGNALLSKAELQSDQGKPEDARATLETFLADYPKHPRFAQGLFALANLYHVSGDREEAESYYQQTIDAQADGELTPLARIRLGDLALEAGDKDAAEQRYQESFALHPGNPFVGYAEEKIALLTVGNPPKVKRPEPEPEPEPTAEEASSTPAPAGTETSAPAPAATETPAPAATETPAPAVPAAPQEPSGGKAPAKGKAKTDEAPKGKAKSPAKGENAGKAKQNPAPAKGKAKEKGKETTPAPKAPAAPESAPEPSEAAPPASE